MTLSKCYWLRTLGRWLAGASMLMLMFAASTRVQAQSPTPVQGTVALEGTMKKFYRGVNTVIVATMDGVEHVYHFTKDLVVHGGKGTGVDALAGLQEGTTVVLHYTVAGTETAVTEIDRVGDEGLRITEGIVTHVDRRQKQITIRFDNRKTEMLRLTERAAAEAGPDFDRAAAGPTKVVVYYRDEAGQKVAHFFKTIS